MHTTAYVVHYSPTSHDEAAEELRRAVEAAGFPVLHEDGFVGVGYAGARWAVGLGGDAGGGENELKLRAAVALAAEDLAARNPGLGAAVVPAALMDAPKKLLVLDVDSTLIKHEVIELLAAHAGKEAEVAAVTEAAMRGELEFAPSLHARVATLAGLESDVIDTVLAAVVLSDGARELVEAFHAAGHAVGVVSGGFIQILGPLAKDLGLDYAVANDLAVEDGLLSGTVRGHVVDRAAKEACLREWAADLGIPLEHTIAAGDGANDLDMLRASGLGVAFNAKPALREQAEAVIDLPRLDIIRHLAGV